jgi:hypothetical protein
VTVESPTRTTSGGFVGGWDALPASEAVTSTAERKAGKMDGGLL